MSAVDRAVQEAAREARRAAQKIVSGTSEQEKLWRDGFVRGAGWRAERMPSVERVEALCRLLVDEGHMTAEGQRQVVALWGAS